MSQKDNSYFPYVVGTHVVLAICHAVAGVEKQSALNYVFAQLHICTEVLQLFDFSFYAFLDNHSSIM
jgi:hypothetical protein